MKVLAVYPYVPWPLNRGAYHRAYHLLKGLASGYEVDLLALAENGEGAEHNAQFGSFCRDVQWLPSMHAAVPVWSGPVFIE